MEQPTPTSSAPSAPRRRINTAAAVALVALLVLAWQWYGNRREITHLQQELARRLSESDAQNRQSLATANQVGDAVRETQAKVAILEEKLQASQDEQVALEALYRELARSRDESVLADIEQMLMVANQQLQIGGNAQAALITLQGADAQLARSDRPQFAGLRKVFARDIERLKLAPAVDVAGISARLNALADDVNDLPLAMELRPAKPAAAPAPADEGYLTRWLRGLWADLHDVVRIQRTQRADLELLTPEQRFFLRENLRLRLLSARIALLARDEDSFKSDMTAVQEWLGRYYDTGDHRTADMQSAVRRLAQSDVGIELPDIGGSLDAVRNYRVSHDKGR